MPGGAPGLHRWIQSIQKWASELQKLRGTLSQHSWSVLVDGPMSELKSDTPPEAPIHPDFGESMAPACWSHPRTFAPVSSLRPSLINPWASQEIHSQGLLTANEMLDEPKLRIWQSKPRIPISLSASPNQFLPSYETNFRNFVLMDWKVFADTVYRKNVIVNYSICIVL